jgi:hypothetical protein
LSADCWPQKRGFVTLLRVELSKQQRVMLAVLALAGLALAVDRVVIGSEAAGPSQAAAQPVPSADVGSISAERSVADAEAASSSSSSGPSSKASVERQSVAQQLEAMQPPQDVMAGVDDAFWDFSRPLEVIEIAESEEAPTTPDAKPLEDVAARHALTAILTTPAGPIAVVDGRALRVDRPSGGLTLRGVDGRSTAIVEIAGQRIRLEIRREALNSKATRGGGNSDAR